MTSEASTTQLNMYFMRGCLASVNAISCIGDDLLIHHCQYVRAFLKSFGHFEHRYLELSGRNSTRHGEVLAIKFSELLIGIQITSTFNTTQNVFRALNNK